jgi:hypothetical protein
MARRSKINAEIANLDISPYSCYITSMPSGPTTMYPVSFQNERFETPS